MKNWALLATNYDEVKDELTFPMIGQPKLNGVRAAWDGTTLWSRQGKHWKPETLPHIYEKLTAWSHTYPGILLDGELFCHGMPFQEIEARTSINRLTAHTTCDSIEYHAFDVISEDDTESRQITLAEIYKPWVAVCRVNSHKEADVWLNRFVEAGFEGLMLRAFDCPYRPGRSTMLVKIKPWKFGSGKITGFVEGLGKYTGTLGALVIQCETMKFSVSGGLKDGDRDAIWNDKEEYRWRLITFKYRDLSNAGKPLQPQLVKI